MNSIKYGLAGFLGILISSLFVYWVIEIYGMVVTHSENDTQIPKDAVLLKEYDMHGSTKLKLWKLDGMCFVSYDLQSTYSSMTSVNCPQKEQP